MPLTSGARLGPYEIVGPLGSGGMGEVYRARDTRLERTVAIKVMPPHVAADPGARERFEREARVISSLDHPNICALYDVGPDYLVMQYLEGETLADRIARGPLPLDELLRYGIEIASALDAAHRAGIVHRDLKPGNVMLTAVGARLLDFGLAKSGTAAVAGSVSIGPTVEQPLTGQGTILGTFQYMSPEQVEGKAADHRTDIFSFGCLLYEMATGRKAFTGTTPASVIGAILHVDPPPMSSVIAQIAGDASASREMSVSALAAARPVPPAFDRLVRKCLAKDPSKRWHCAADLADELRWIAEGSAADPRAAAAPAAADPRAATQHRRRERVAWAAAALCAAAAAVAGGWTVLRVEPEAPVLRTTLLTSADLASGGQSTIAVSPTGTHVAYVVTSASGRNVLHVRGLDESTDRALRGTEDAQQPFFSADGRWIGFIAAGKLKKVAVTGGAPLAISDIGAQPRGAAWGGDNTIVYSGSATEGLSRVHADGGAPQKLTTPAKGERGHRWPSFLPDGRVLFNIVPLSGAVDGTRVAVASLDGGEPKVVFEGGSYPRFSATGHLIVARPGGLVSVPFELGSLTTRGGPVSVVDGVALNLINGAAQFDIAPAGLLVYRAGDAMYGPLVIADRTGKSTPVLEQRAIVALRYAPDGRRIALTIQEAQQDIWIFDVDRKTITRFTTEPGRLNSNPVWTPDGKRIIYASSVGGAVMQLVWKAADGSGPEEVLLPTSEVPHLPHAVSPDGRFLAYTPIRAAAGGPDIWMLPLGGDRTPRPFIESSFTETAPAFSPDGRWVAYQSNTTGQLEIYVQPFPGPGGKIAVSAGGGTAPRWANGGRELLFRRGASIMSVPVTLSPAFSAGAPVKLFEVPHMQADVTADGRQFALLTAPESSPARQANQLQLVVNWFAELKQKVPPK